MTRSKLFKALRTLIGFAAAILMLRYVVIRSGIDPIEVWVTMDRRYLIIAFLSFGCGLVLAAYRWYLLLHHINVMLSLPVVVRLALIGQFFNLFVPGGVGGDLIKAVYLRKEAGERFAEAVLTVLLDRILGLLGLLILALIAVGINPALLEDSSPEMRTILLVVGLAGVAGLGVVSLFFLWPYLARFSSVFKGVQGRLPERLSGILDRLVQAFSLLRSAPGKVLLLLGVAMVVHLFATVAVMSVGQGIGGVSELNFQEYLLATQLSNLVAAVPLTPGGLGGRDLTMAFLLKLGGGSAAASGGIPIVVTTLLVTWSALGGLALLWERRVVEPGEAHEGQNISS